MSRTKVIILSIVAGLVIVAIAIQLIISAGYKKKSREELALLVAEGGSRNILDMVPKPLGNLGDKPLELLYADDFTVTMWDKSSKLTTVNYKDPNVPDVDKAFSAFRKFSMWTPASSIVWDANATEPKAFDEEWLPWLEMVTSDCGPLLDHIRTNASNGDGMFYVNWTQGAKAQMPHVARVREDVRLLRVDAYIRMRRGDTVGAVADVCASLRLRDTLDHDPILISKLVAFSADGISLGTLAMVVEEGQPDREGVEGMLKEIEGREERNRMTGALLGSTAMDLDVIDMIAKDPGIYRSLWDFTGAVTSNTPEDKIDKVLNDFAFRATWNRDADEYNLLREMRVLREWSRKPLIESIEMPSYATRIGGTREGARRVTDRVVRDLERIFEMEARADLNIAKTRLLLAVYLYRLDNGAYPESAEALVPRYLPQVPADPFDNRPLLYTRKGDGCTIESAREKESAQADDVAK